MGRAYRSCPAVSQICSLTRFPSRSTVRILKSMLHIGSVIRAQRYCTHPIVVMKLGVKVSSEKRRRRQLLPTPSARGEPRENTMPRRTAVSDKQELDEVVKACARGRHPRGRCAVRRALAVASGTARLTSFKRIARFGTS